MKIILIGEAHDKSDGPEFLLQKINNVENESKLYLFFEASDKWVAGRLWTIWGSEDVKLKRRGILGKIIFPGKLPKYQCVFADINYTSKYYINDTMREDKITSKIIEFCNIACNQTTIILLIGIAHLPQIILRLKTASYTNVEVYYPKYCETGPWGKNVLRLSMDQDGCLYAYHTNKKIGLEHKLHDTNVEEIRLLRHQSGMFSPRPKSAEYLSKHRHDSPESQREYDKQFGLILKPT